MGRCRGYSIRTPDFRYTEWLKPGKENVPQWEKIVGRELYDHVKDPGENRNCAEEERYAQVVRKLRDLLHAGWRGAVPDL